MIDGEFSDDNKLIFDFELIASTGETIPVEAILDTGFTQWLAVSTPG